MAGAELCGAPKIKISASSFPQGSDILAESSPKIFSWGPASLQRYSLKIVSWGSAFPQHHPPTCSPGVQHPQSDIPPRCSPGVQHPHSIIPLSILLGSSILTASHPNPCPHVPMGSSIPAASCPQDILLSLIQLLLWLLSPYNSCWWPRTGSSWFLDRTSLEIVWGEFCRIFAQCTSLERGAWLL